MTATSTRPTFTNPDEHERVVGLHSYVSDPDGHERPVGKQSVKKNHQSVARAQQKPEGATSVSVCTNRLKHLICKQSRRDWDEVAERCVDATKIIKEILQTTSEVTSVHSVILVSGPVEAAIARGRKSKSD